MHCLWGNIENKEGFKTAHKICNKLGRRPRSMDHRLIMAFFSQLSVEFKIMIFSYLDRFIGWHQKSGDPFLGLTNLLQAFLKGSGCLLGSSEQTNRKNHLSEIHFKKSLLSFGKMESAIEFILTYHSCRESFLSNYRLICHLSGSHSSTQRWDRGED